MKIYGWHEMNTISWCIVSKDVKPKNINKIDEEGRVFLLYNSEDDETDGCWWTTFSQAKREAIAYWREQKDIAIEALKYVKRIKKSQV
jgi:hypothetical protein